MNYAKLLEHSFAVDSTVSECPPNSRLEFLSDQIFGFTTYDSSVSELFARKAVEVCEAITSRTASSYCAKQGDYVWYLLMCNMPFFADRIDWGTSVRGAWWAARSGDSIEFQSCGLWVGDKQLTDALNFSAADWERFVRAVIGFAAPDTGARTVGDLITS